MKMYLLFSHRLTSEQMEDAKRMGVEEFVPLPEHLQKKWSNVPAELESLDGYADEFFEFLSAADEGDFVLVQGDFGMCCRVVSFCRQNSLTAVYSTTKRVAKEIRKGDKVVKISEFRHIRYRRY